MKLHQAAGGVISITHHVDGQPLDGITAAKYQLFGRNGEALVTKSHSDGISFIDGQIVIVLSESDTAGVSGVFTHECSVRDLSGRAIFVLTDTIQFIPTKTRL